ncbi:basement membrane-specific heparan sulfate proteoglycan core protein-like [Seriola lalandi dorsalis]|uniref:basement membrane-specific heparan sulfate proteoglycan core protein-like n=1 Tax=Seriola lalandi dorsalis TaxID=1841481 RepID=UPI000C6F9EA0|nr:basement membrane-specific heparan sulfate proteoglycan core protein-like [Seriola lalandi dorsalis]
MGHTLLCVLSLFLLNTLFYGKAEVSSSVTVTLQPNSSLIYSADKPKATLRADRRTIPAGGRVALTCSVDGSDDWKYYGFRRDSHSVADPVRDVRAHGVMVVSEGGFYRCRGGRGDPELFSQNSEEVLIQKTVYSWVTVTLQPSSSLIYSGEKITVRCEMQGGGDTGWTYEWRTPSSNNPPSHSEYTISRATESHSGDYSCRGRRDYYLTEWSQVMRLTVSRSEATATLTADRTVLAAGGRVTLTCSVDRSYSWKYVWFRRTSVSSEAQTVGDTDQPNTVITQGGVYTCRGRRGQPEFFTQESSKVTIKETVSSRVTVTLQPNWSAIYRGETITVKCEIQGGGDTGWTYEWRTTSSNNPPSHSEYTISRVTESHRGDYWCREKPRPVLTVSPSWLSPGASVTLKCEVELPSAGWRFYWYKAVPDGSQRSYRYELLPGSSRGTEQDSYIVRGQTHTAGYVCKAGRGDPVIYTETSELKFVWSGGLYWCRGGRGDPVYYTEFSLLIRIDTIVSSRVILQPNWSVMYRGETITVSCEIQGGDTEWTYEWKTNSSLKPSNQHEYRISSASSSHSGDYRCRGRMKSAQHNTTEWSDSVKLTVYDNKPRPVLTVSPSWLSPGASVTLKCEVELPSAGWRFYWYKAVPDGSQRSYSYELLPGSSSGTEQDSYIVHGQTHTAGYVCKAGRGDPVIYTETSELKFVWSGDVRPSASLTVSPDRVQHFTSDSVSLSCEGNSTEWRVRRFPEGYYLSCSDFGIITGSTCNIDSYGPSNAVYWCESGSGEFSNTVNITLQKRNISSVFFYQNDKLIQNDSRVELNISAVSQSDEGFYKCQSSGKVSAQSWMSVKAVPRPESSSFPVLLIVGPVCGIVLIVLLLLFFRYRNSKDPCCNRFVQHALSSPISFCY